MKFKYHKNGFLDLSSLPFDGEPIKERIIRKNRTLSLLTPDKRLPHFFCWTVLAVRELYPKRSEIVCQHCKFRLNALFQDARVCLTQFEESERT